MREKVPLLLWIVLIGVVFYPGGIYLQRVNSEVLGMPFFAFWTIIVAPLVFITFWKLSSIYQSRVGGDTHGV